MRDVTHWFVDCCSEANSFESGQRHLENFQVHAGKNKNTDSTYMGMRRGYRRDQWRISRTLVNQPVNQDVAPP